MRTWRFPAKDPAEHLSWHYALPCEYGTSLASGNRVILVFRAAVPERPGRAAARNDGHVPSEPSKAFRVEATSS